MVHVHQVLPLLFKSARIAIDNLARFIERSRYIRDEQERSSTNGGASTTQSKSSSPLKASPVTPTRTFAAVLRKVSVRESPPTNGDKKEEEVADQKVVVVPAFMQPTMARGKSAEDGVEWVIVEQNGRETAGDEGTAIPILINAWPLRQQESKEE
jgi:hypothetical protein